MSSTVHRSGASAHPTTQAVRSHQLVASPGMVSRQGVGIGAKMVILAARVAITGVGREVTV